jgi:hypothetical protein
MFGSGLSPNDWTEDIRSSREGNQLPLLMIIPNVLLSYSPLVWLGVIGTLFFSSLPTLIRAALCSFLALQSFLIYWVLPYDTRFLGGVQFGLLIAFAAFAAPCVQDRLASARYIAPSWALLLLPWLGIQIYYAKQFFPVSLRLEKRAFYERYIAFFKDYVELDRLLSDDTVLLVTDFRLSSVYAPRPVFFDPADLPKGKQVVLFAAPTLEPESSLSGYKRGKAIYMNSKAITKTYRTPGRNPETGPLEVRKLVGSPTSKLILPKLSVTTDIFVY